MDTYSVAQQTSLLEETSIMLQYNIIGSDEPFVCFIDFCSIKVLNCEHYRQKQKHYRQNQKHYGWCE